MIKLIINMAYCFFIQIWVILAGRDQGKNGAIISLIFGLYWNHIRVILSSKIMYICTTYKNCLISQFPLATNFNYHKYYYQYQCRG